VQKHLENQDLIARQFPKDKPATRGRAALKNKLVSTKELLAAKRAAKAAQISQQVGNLIHEGLNSSSSDEWNSEDEREMRDFAAQVCEDTEE